MSSAASKGSHYKARTKAWLEAQGYQVGFLERMMLIGHGRKDPATGAVLPPFPIKKDQFGSDLLAVGHGGIIFVQCKLGRENILKALREFGQFVFPQSPIVKQWVVVWEKGAREPEIIEASQATVPPLPPTEADIPFPPVKRRRKDTAPRLFR